MRGDRCHVVMKYDGRARESERVEDVKEWRGTRDEKNCRESKGFEAGEQFVDG